MLSARCIFAITLALCANACSAGDTSAQQPAPPPVVSGGLNLITLVIGDATAAAVFCSAWGMTPLQQPEAPPHIRKAQAAMWQLPPGADWQEHICSRTATPDAPSLRIVSVTPVTPLVRSSATELKDGGFSLGFLVANAEVAHALAQKNPERLSGDPGTGAVVLRGPENVLLTAQPGTAEQAAQLDGATGIGGPVSAAIVMADVDAEVAFLRAALGLEVRGDERGVDAALNRANGLPPQADARLVRLAAAGTNTGELLLIGLAAHGQRNEVAVTPPSRGMVLWTFPVRDILQARDRVREAKGLVVWGPARMVTFFFGDHKVLIARSPGGFFYELVELAAG